MKFYANIVLHLFTGLCFVICINAACDVNWKCDLCTKSGCNYVSCHDFNKTSLSSTCTNATNVSSLCSGNSSAVIFNNTSHCPNQNISANGESSKDPVDLAVNATVVSVVEAANSTNSTTAAPTIPSSPQPNTSTPSPTTTSTTAIPPTITVPTTTAGPITTTTSTATTPTQPPTVKTTVAPIPYTPGGRRFDAPSFFGGIILAFGLVAISCICYKFYRARTEHNYHTLRETLHM